MIQSYSTLSYEINPKYIPNGVFNILNKLKVIH